jgi:hypothetical protein
MVISQSIYVKSAGGIATEKEQQQLSGIATVF